MRKMVAVLVAVCCVQTACFASEYKIDPVHSSSLFKVQHMGAGFVYGQFTKVEGSIAFDPADPEASSVNVTIESASLTTHDQGRDRHISGPDFFNVKEFPVITFNSTSWKKMGENTYEVSGDLTLIGVKKAITVTVEHVGTGKNPRTGKELLGFHTVFQIDRSDFGMKYGIVPNGSGLGKDIELILSVEAGER